jgi:CheY-like chemotaxis protein
MKKIMIIEDNTDLQEIYKLNFTKAGYDVRIAGDGLSGITQAIEFEPDVVLLDIMMPEMNGVEFLKTLRNNTSKRYPIIVSTNISDQYIFDECMKLGVKAVLLKSEYNGQQLVDKVNSYLE